MNDIKQYQQTVETREINRAEQIRRDNDTVVTPKITLYDIDYSVYWYLSQGLKLKVIENDTTIDVPVMFANSERWSQIRKYGFLRDNQQKIVAPLIVLKRSDFMDDDRFKNPNYQNNNQFNFKIYPYKTNNMQHDRTRGQFATKNSFEYYTVGMPRYVRVNYEILVWTDYIEQMNSIVETIYSTSNYNWGDFHKFRTVINSISHDNSNTDDRIIKTNINITTDGYLLPEYKFSENNMQKQYTLKRVDFMNEKQEMVIYEDENELPKNKRHISEIPSEELRITKNRLDLL